MVVNEEAGETKVHDQGTVISSGCIQTVYKGHPVHDCRTDIAFIKNGKKRLSIPTSVLPGDEVVMSCAYFYTGGRRDCWLNITGCDINCKRSPINKNTFILPVEE